MNGWNVPLLQEALDKCGLETGGDVRACAPLVPYLDNDAMQACKPSKPIVNELVGFGTPLKSLPGCNPLWSGTGPKPGCDATGADPAYTSGKSTPAPGYSLVGCVAEAPNGRLLTGKSMASTSNMTIGACTAFCAQSNYEYAGVEYGQECYCGSLFSNGGNNATLPGQ